MARLAQVIKKLNIGLSTAVEFLNKKGEQLENNPNTRLTDEQESLLVKEFSTAETIKMEADRQNHLRQEQEKEKLAEEVPAPVVEKVEEIKIEIERPHIKPIAKIDLESVGKPKAKKEEPKPEKEETPIKPEPTPKAEPILVEKPQEKIVETPIVKPVVKTIQEEKLATVEPVSEEKDKVFTLRKVEVENTKKDFLQLTHSYL